MKEKYPTSELLQDELDIRGWTYADLAEKAAVPVKEIMAVIHEGRRITPELSAHLGKAFNMSSKYWLVLDKANS